MVTNGVKAPAAILKKKLHLKSIINKPKEFRLSWMRRVDSWQVHKT
jgi:hypothetical protein